MSLNLFLKGHSHLSLNIDYFSVEFSQIWLFPDNLLFIISELVNQFQQFHMYTPNWRGTKSSVHRFTLFMTAFPNKHNSLINLTGQTHFSQNLTNSEMTTQCKMSNVRLEFMFTTEKEVYFSQRFCQSRWILLYWTQRKMKNEASQTPEASWLDPAVTVDSSLRSRWPLEGFLGLVERPWRRAALLESCAWRSSKSHMRLDVMLRYRETNVKKQENNSKMNTQNSMNMLITREPATPLFTCPTLSDCGSATFISQGQKDFHRHLQWHGFHNNRSDFIILKVVPSRVHWTSLEQNKSIISLIRPWTGFIKANPKTQNWEAGLYVLIFCTFSYQERERLEKARLINSTCHCSSCFLLRTDRIRSYQQDEKYSSFPARCLSLYDFHFHFIITIHY